MDDAKQLPCDECGKPVPEIVHVQERFNRVTGARDVKVFCSEACAAKQRQGMKPMPIKPPPEHRG